MSIDGFQNLFRKVIREQRVQDLCSKKLMIFMKHIETLLTVALIYRGSFNNTILPLRGLLSNTVILRPLYMEKQ